MFVFSGILSCFMFVYGGVVKFEFSSRDTSAFALSHFQKALTVGCLSFERVPFDLNLALFCFHTQLCARIADS